MSIPKPNRGEYTESYEPYIQAASDANWSNQMESTANEWDSVLRPLSDAAWLSRYEPGKWTIKSVVQHVIDAERIFAYRALRFARADATALAGFEEDNYAQTAGADRRSGDSLLDELRAVRRSTILLFESFPEESWTRSGLANQKSMTVRGAAWVTLGHQLHHLNVLKERYLHAR